jgi:hypothetical protein
MISKSSESSQTKITHHFSLANVEISYTARLLAAIAVEMFVCNETIMHHSSTVVRLSRWHIALR